MSRTTVGVRNAKNNLCNMLRRRRSFAVTRHGDVVAHFYPIGKQHPWLRRRVEYVGVQQLHRLFCEYMRRFSSPAAPLVITFYRSPSWVVTRKPHHIF